MLRESLDVVDPTVPQNGGREDPLFDSLREYNQILEELADKPGWYDWKPEKIVEYNSSLGFFGKEIPLFKWGVGRTGNNNHTIFPFRLKADSILCSSGLERFEEWRRPLREHLCYVCQLEKAKQVCRNCKVVRYCGPVCQKKVWHSHRPLCKKQGALKESEILCNQGERGME